MTDQTLNAALHFFSDTIVLTNYDDEGGQTSYPVSLPDVAAALSDVSLGSTLLPPNTLFWQRFGGVERLGVFVPRRRWAVRVRPQKGVVEDWVVPMPPLLWTGHGTKYSLWALRRRPKPGEDPELFVAPTPNVFDARRTGGAICAGTVRFPVCSATTIESALAMFFASEFNTHISFGKCQSYPDDSVLNLWRDLDGKSNFPVRELVSAEMPLSYLIEKETTSG